MRIAKKKNLNQIGIYMLIALANKSTNYMGAFDDPVKLPESK